MVQQRIARWEPLVDQVYDEMNVPAELRPILKAQIHQESKWDSLAVSTANARGLTQFIPSTARQYGVQYGNSEAAVRSQVRGQVNYMNYLLKMFNSNITHALQAYNTGEGNLQKHLQGKKTLRQETREYVPKIQQWTGYYR